MSRGIYPMNGELRINADTSYQRAEQKAERYFKSLYEQLLQKTYVPTLTKDFQSWKHNHIHHSFLSFFSNGNSQPNSQGYHSYIQWLDYTGKLDNYLDRSISYIFLRDLGKTLNSTETKASIQRFVNSLKTHLTQRKDTTETFSVAGLYRLAQKDGIESTLIWVLNKLKIVASNIPEGMDAEHAQRKLIKIIGGVVLHQIEEMGDDTPPTVRTQKLDEAIRLGYSYGLTYPFIDDLLDAKILTATEEKHYSDLIRTTLRSGSVPELGAWAGENKELIEFIHSELKEAYEYIDAHQRRETRANFLEQSYVFFHAQETDRAKSLSNATYTNEELYIPIILKSSSSRLIARSVMSAPVDEGFDERSFYYGIYNQLADDFADMFDDLKDGAVTPYTYYLKYHEKRSDLINPFELYWTVISNLIHHVYESDSKTCEVILDRAVNGLKRYKEKMGKKKYNEVMDLFTAGIPKFNRILQKMVQKADDVDFFDKLLRDHMITNLRNERLEREEFIDLIKNVRNEINAFLTITTTGKTSMINNPIIDAANYSLNGDGKRLRPIMTWVMGVNEYGLKSSAILPLLKSLEYMHTASLIFDDLPSQANASIRRGRPTLHQVYNMGIAELTGLYLTQKAIEEQASLDQFDPKQVLKLIKYSAQVTEDICRGQAMDLDSKGKPLTLEQLNTLSFYKTGKAFEASLLMPAILAQANDIEIEALRKYAYHSGIAFQIKDDLLDVEGVDSLLGKPIGKDAENNNSTFVSILGLDNARKAMWEHYCQALEALQDVPRNTTFLKHLMDYIVNRDH
ncbi:MAG: geranyltranstransferase [Neobacillus sp.]|nr:geranyltranstransferase [Neobacillus sp.]